MFEQEGLRQEMRDKLGSLDVRDGVGCSEVQEE